MSKVTLTTRIPAGVLPEAQGLLKRLTLTSLKTHQTRRGNAWSAVLAMEREDATF